MLRDLVAATRRIVRVRLGGSFGWLTTVSVTGAWGILVAVTATASLACFSLKQPPCAFSCADPPNLCPANYTCGTDELCHRAGATALCPLTSPHDGALEAVDSTDGGGGGAD